MNGGTVSLYLRAYDSSTFTMIGGEVDRLNAYDSSTITMSDGVMGRLVAYDTSTVRMSGGGAEGISLSGSATVILSGGTVSSYLVADDSSTFTMNGGEAGVISSAGSSTVTLSGGAVGTEVGDRLVANDSSTVTIIGNRFRVDGGPVPYGDLSAQAGTLTGTLESEDPINIMFYQGGWTEYPCTDQTPCSGTIRLAPPLPALSSWGQLALAAGLLGAAALRRREMPLAG
jgi:hypothetical protein